MFSTCLFTSGYKKRKSIRENGFYLDSQEHFIWKKKQKTEASTDFPSSSPRCVLLLLSKVFEQLSVYLFVFGVCMLWGFPTGDAVSWGAGYAKWQIQIACRCELVWSQSVNVWMFYFTILNVNAPLLHTQCCVWGCGVTWLFIPFPDETCGMKRLAGWLCHVYVQTLEKNKTKQNI